MVFNTIKAYQVLTISVKSITICILKNFFRAHITPLSGTRNRWLCAIGTVIVFALSLAGCATSVPIKSVRPPTINTSDIQRLAVKDFENKSGIRGPLGVQLANYLTDQSRQLIGNTGYFTLVNHTDPNADGVFTGEIKSITVNDSQEAKQRKDSAGNIIAYTLYTRDVSIEFSYSVISSRTRMPVGSVHKNGSQIFIGEQLFPLAEPLTLAKQIIDSQLRTLQRDIVPTIVSTSRTLMKETLKNKTVRQMTKTAQSYVRNNNYEEAIRQYDAIDSEYGSAAARINASILREAVASDAAARAKLTALFNDKDGLIEKAAKSAIDALHSKLPSGTNIIIVKTSSTQRNMLDSVVDQMTRTVIQAGKLKLVERSNLDLIEAEQEYQLSGYVSDDSIVSIGHQLGAQYIVLCWISGQMSTRRLNLSVLNIETAEVIDQRDFEI